MGRGRLTSIRDIRWEAYGPGGSLHQLHIRGDVLIGMSSLK